ncbi:MAG TPA: Uma2 family endonuclease [Fimbriimonadaceae bacterium]|nr:Uma2 family endonuclease [Fimbriimonadaceae bacterium]
MMNSVPEDFGLYASLIAADEAGIKIEMVEGIGSWEMMPNPRHQTTVFKIQQTIRRAEMGTDCGCFQYADVYVRFKDGSFKRPDIAIYCQELPDIDGDHAVTQIPEAVIEVLSKGYEAKDLEIGAPFYLKMGVKDVIVVDPKSGQIHHFRPEGTKVLQSPQLFQLECGCLVDV